MCVLIIFLIVACISNRNMLVTAVCLSLSHTVSSSTLLHLLMAEVSSSSVVLSAIFFLCLRVWNRRIGKVQKSLILMIMFVEVRFIPVSFVLAFDMNCVCGSICVIRGLI